MRPQLNNEQTDWPRMLGHAVANAERLAGYAQKLEAYATQLEKELAELKAPKADEPKATEEANGSEVTG